LGDFVCILQALRVLGIRRKLVGMDKKRQVHNPWFLVLGTREIAVEEFYLDISISDIP
jgi:hypothetical protein